jgi:hypothetical protein
MNKVFDLGIHGIKVEIEYDENNITSGYIISELKDDKDDCKYNNMVDVLESIILAHAMEDINILDEKYINGIITTLDSIFNNHD